MSATNWILLVLLGIGILVIIAIIVIAKMQPTYTQDELDELDRVLGRITAIGQQKGETKENIDRALDNATYAWTEIRNRERKSGKK